MGIIRALDLIFTVIIGLVLSVFIVGFFTALWCCIPLLLYMTFFNVQSIPWAWGIVAFIIVGCGLFIGEILDDNTPTPTSPAIRGMEEHIKQLNRSGGSGHVDPWRGDWPGRI